MRKICIVSGTRAEYGQLRPLMEMISSSENTMLQLVVTGMHLSPEFGLTYREIENDGFCIDRKIESLVSSDTAVGIGKSTGLGVIGFAEALSDLAPDLVVLLGDRFEVLAAAVSSLYARIPIAHIHGGETTEGAFDEGIRHAITKMAHLHFVAAADYRNRVVQLGEEPERVFHVGGLGVDAMKREELLSQEELEESIGFKFGEVNLLVTFHPVTLENNTSERQIGALLDAFRRLDGNVHFIITLPNADTDGRIITEKINAFAREYPSRVFVATSLGQKRYWSTMKYVDAVVGNSSSGLAEAPSFKVATVNIGDRQKGRLMATSVLNCGPKVEQIELAIKTALGDSFKESLKDTKNLYGEGGASSQIFDIISSVDLGQGLLKKKFYDLASGES